MQTLDLERAFSMVGSDQIGAIKHAKDMAEETKGSFQVHPFDILLKKKVLLAGKRHCLA